MSRSIPVITVEPSGPDFVLYAESYGHRAVCGPRILRGNGVLDIDVRHATRELAEVAAEKLRTYLAGQGKPGKHRGEVVATPRLRGYWED